MAVAMNAPPPPLRQPLPNATKLPQLLQLPRGTLTDAQYGFLIPTALIAILASMVMYSSKFCKYEKSRTTDKEFQDTLFYLSLFLWGIIGWVGISVILFIFRFNVRIWKVVAALETVSYTLGFRFTLTSMNMDWVEKYPPLYRVILELLRLVSSGVLFIYILQLKDKLEEELIFGVSYFVVLLILFGCLLYGTGKMYGWQWICIMSKTGFELALYTSSVSESGFFTVLSILVAITTFTICYDSHESLMERLKGYD